MTRTAPSPKEHAMTIGRYAACCATYFSLVFGILMALLWLNHGPLNLAHDAMGAAVVAGPVSLLAMLRT